ncbi:glycosyltransferase [Thioflexithrix psekupsensis]|uniref:Glycosyl transferase family 1 domain-containing protein n=1 Tax=Thioflexithrix psekupsensis TaxID=1570016 RepID=A0A251XA94_9GAMM|nr:glycosyltransferase [Thioflexithrix psekupsensis]OUD15351.1 hypothetical protein TPSD3_02135 [Thioflexithrix psekupsensis]
MLSLIFNPVLIKEDLTMSIPSDVTIFLVAPNVSEQMGGEGMKALQIFQELKKLHPNTIQVTHERTEAEIVNQLKLPDVLFVRDDAKAIFLWRSKALQWFVNIWFCQSAIKLIENYVKEKGLNPAKVIVHQTEPNSPVMPRVIARSFYNVFGPINGNIYYPKMFRQHEVLSAKLRRIFHIPFQKINRLFFRGATKADLLLIAGGDRTWSSMRIGGVPEAKMVECLDCGVKDDILNRPRVQHQGQNMRFVHFGRLVFHKGTALIIESLAHTQHPITLDVVGRGPELAHCKALAKQLNVEDRVHFLDWYPQHSDLLDSFTHYRGFILPSIEDANGIVVQEGMALGLPGICLDWGGPQLLVEEGVTGYLIKPTSREFIVTQMAQHLDRLAMDGELAEKMSIKARAKAEEWRWSKVMAEWITHYQKIIASRSLS